MAEFRELCKQIQEQKMLGVLNEKSFQIDFSPSVLWLIITSSGKLLYAPQSHLDVYYKSQPGSAS